MTEKPSAALRLATYNTSLYSDDAGGLIKELEGDSEHARKIAAVLQQVRPDLVLLNEFDFDDAHRAADLFQKRYLEVAQPGGGKPLHFAYRYLAPVNTGVPSGLDLDNNGVVGGEGRSRGNDAWGYGLHPGQYGMLVLSRYPIDEAKVRSFQLLKWSAMPGAIRPVDPRTGQSFYNDHVWSQLRLSSKSHWDVPVKTPAGVVHALVSHPTPPVFDGPEKRNAARNHDELRLWQEYLSKGDKPWLCDDKGQCGGLAQDARFVILGDLNNDPADGDGRHEAIVELIENARVLRYPTRAASAASRPAWLMRPRASSARARRSTPPAISARSPARCAWTTCCPPPVSSTWAAASSGRPMRARKRRSPTAATTTWCGWTCGSVDWVESTVGRLHGGRRD